MSRYGAFERSRSWILLPLLLLAADLAWAVPLRGPISIDVTDDGQHAVVAFRKDNSVAIVDLSSPPPHAFANLGVTDGIRRRPVKVRCFGSTAVVVHEYDTELTLVDVQTATVSGHVSVPLYSQDVVWDASRSRYYVSNASLNRVLVFDASWQPLGDVQVGGQPGPMTFGPLSRLWVGNHATWDVSVVDLDALLEIDRVFIGSRPEGVAASAAAVYVTNHGGAALPRLNGVPLIDDDQTEIVNVLTEIDPAGFGRVDRFLDQGGDYSGVDVRAGLVAFGASQTGSVHIHRLADPPDTLQTVDLLDDPWGLPGGRAPSGLRIFTVTRDVAVVAADRVLAINFMRDSLVELRSDVDGDFGVVGETAFNAVGVPITGFQDPPAVNFTPVQNGERYFHSASAWFRGQRDFSCATCHSNGHSDLRMFVGHEDDPFNPTQSQGPERHPSVRVSGPTAPYGWEGNRPSLLDFNIAALDKHDLPPANGEVHVDVAEFMVLYEENQRPGPVPYGKNEAGRLLFEGAAGCAGCHLPPAFTDNGFADVGTGRTLNTPTLIGLWDRPSYLHDGRAASLADVLDSSIYEPNSHHGNLDALTAQQKQELVEFLLSLGPDVCIEIVGPDPSTGLRMSKAPCAVHQVQDPPIDVLRTTLSNVRALPGSIDLGPSTCLANQHQDTRLEDTAYDGTAASDLWIFLVRDGELDYYGSSSDGRLRVPSSGDCRSSPDAP